MPYKTGNWGEQAKERAKRRREYYRLRYHKIKANLDVQDSLKKTIGYKGELFAKDFLVGSNLIRKHYDIDWQGKKIDVKTSKPHAMKRKFKKKTYIFKIWHFTVDTQRDEVDYFLLLCMNEEEEVIRIYFIPNKEISADGLYIGFKNSKYEKYLVKARPWKTAKVMAELGKL